MPASGHSGISATSLAKILLDTPLTGYNKVQLCAVSKSSHQLFASKLMPLPIPDRPWWSHIAVDFIMELPVLKGYTTF